MAQKTIELLKKGELANQNCPFRRGSLISLPAQGSLVVAGDMHGHKRNFDRVKAYADLANHSNRHVILQEIIHGGPKSPSGGCLSFEVLFDAIRFQQKFPHQVHFILGNHDTACITQAEVMKDSREMNYAFTLGLKDRFGADAKAVESAIHQFMLSQVLAVKTENCVWISHSLPSDRLVSQFDPHIFGRALTFEDCVKPGSAYILTWGRKMSQSLLNQMAKTLKAEVFIVGHQAQPDGWRQAGDNLVIIASDHNHGCLIHIQLDTYCSANHLAQAIKPLSSIC